MILVTGASGHLGSLVIDHLLEKTSKDNIIAFTRNTKKAKEYELHGIKSRIGDFDDPTTLETAFDGIDKMLMISTLAHNRLEQQSRVIDAARKAGVSHIAYTGVAMRDVDSSVLKDFMSSHFQTEAYLKNSGIAYTLLRNSLYMEVIPMYVGKEVFGQGIFLPAGEGKVPYALRTEMAEAAAKVLTGEGHENKVYNISGTALYSYYDVADTLSKLSGKPVHYTIADEAGFVEKMKQSGLPEMAITITNGFAIDIKNQQYEIESGDLEQLLGRKPASLEKGLQLIYQL